MAKNSKGALMGAVMSLVLLVPKLFNFMGNISTLVKLEAQQAGRNLTIIVLLMFISAILLTSSWLCLLGLAYLYLVSLHIGAIPALTIVTIFNLLLLLIIGLIIYTLKRNLFFPATFAQLSKAKLKL
jgi:hypothetical protein